MLRQIRQTQDTMRISVQLTVTRETEMLRLGEQWKYCKTPTADDLWGQIYLVKNI